MEINEISNALFYRKRRKVAYFAIVSAIYFFLPLFRGNEPKLYERESSDIGDTITNNSDYKKPNFEYLINPSHTCKESDDMYMLAAVYSSPQNSYRRRLIRKSWNRKSLYATTKLKALFFIGTTSDRKVQEKIDKEAFIYNDIVQQDYIDTYYNLSLKASSWIQWSCEYCPQAKFTLKTDDDVIVNVFELVKAMTNLTRSVGKDLRTRTIVGRMWHSSKISREIDSKFGVGFDEYGGEIFPDYTSGCGYVVGNGLVCKLLDATRHVPPFKFEDVWVTGILRTYVGADIISIFDRYLFMMDIDDPDIIYKPIFRLFEKLDLSWFSHWKSILTENKFEEKVIKASNVAI